MSPVGFISFHEGMNTKRSLFRGDFLGLALDQAHTEQAGTRTGRARSRAAGSPRGSPAVWKAYDPRFPVSPAALVRPPGPRSSVFLPFVLVIMVQAIAFPPAFSALAAGFRVVRKVVVPLYS